MIFEAVFLGLFFGLISTVAMFVIEVPAWKRWGLPGVLEWDENQSIAGKLLNKPKETVLLPGIVFHFIHGAIAGLLFVLAITLASISDFFIILGALYGVLLWIFGIVIYKPIVGRRTSDNHITGIAFIVNLSSHVVYGLSLGILVGLQ